MGDVLNLNLPPVMTCAPGLPCRTKCYAMKAWRQYPSTRAAWKGNLAAGPMAIGRAVDSALGGREPGYFRWHSAGDIPGMAYYRMMLDTAKRWPEWGFLAFTKRWVDMPGMLAVSRPRNLQIIRSTWPGFATPRGARRAFVQDGTETRGASAFKCPGSCAECKVCWDGTGDVIFDIH